MKDRSFTGKDVAEAVRTAALTLGLKEAELRYFVLDPGGEGRFGGEPNPARIAVLMDAPTGPRPAPFAEGKSRPASRSPSRDVPKAGLEADDDLDQDDDLEVALSRDRKSVV